jgi:hypothetical protein
MPRLVTVAMLVENWEHVPERSSRQCVALRRDAEVPKCGQVLTRWTTTSNSGDVACES